MSYATIAVHVDCRQESEGRLKCARALADHFGAAILGVGAEQIPPIGFDNGYVNYDGLWVARMQEAIDINLAEAMRPDLIVAGAYGRSRLGEWVFGGVTRGLLAEEIHFVLLSH